jgi:NAD(P)-dependent dehydrogenase (short-subunit alcohol dehydrogenase family)
LKDKICIITGATGGIGLRTAEGLAAQGAQLALVARNPEKAARVGESLRRLGASSVEIFQADLSRQDDIRRVSAELLERLPRIDVLINNAGAFYNKRVETADGIEMTFALNHLAPFLMTNLLLEQLIENKARIVTVASMAHGNAQLDFDDLELKNEFGGWKSYARSKLGNIMFTNELARRLDGTGATANSLHPGFVRSNFGSNNGILLRIGMWLAMRFAISEVKGAATSIYLASSPEVAEFNGRYFDKCRPRYSSRISQVEESWVKLWDQSEKMVGLAKA